MSKVLEGEIGIEVTEKACPICGTELRMIVGVTVKTEYCANYKCIYLGNSHLTKLGKELTS